MWPFVYYIRTSFCPCLHFDFFKTHWLPPDDLLLSIFYCSWNSFIVVLMFSLKNVDIKFVNRFAFRGNRSNHTVVSARRKFFSFFMSWKIYSIFKWHKLFFVTVCLLLSSHFLCIKHQSETSVAGTWRNVFAKSLGPCDTKTPPSMLSCSSAFCLFIYYSMGSSTRLCQTEYV